MTPQDWTSVIAIVGLIGLVGGYLVGWKKRTGDDAVFRSRVEEHLRISVPLIEDLLELKTTVRVNQEQIGTLIEAVRDLSTDVRDLLRFHRQGD